MTYILVDSLNMFYRARHVVRGDDIETKIGMAYHIMFSAINKAWRDFDGKHVVFCFEGRSWRKDHYTPYKANRKEARDALTPREQEEDQAFFAAFDELKEFIEKRTNCTTLQHKTCEADDFIARFIQNHPDDNHVIISSDSDFYQLQAQQLHNTTALLIAIFVLMVYIMIVASRLLISKLKNKNKLAILNGCCLKSVYVVIQVTMCLVRTQVLVRKALRIKLVC